MGLCIRMELDLGMGTGLRSSDQGLPSGPPNAGGPGSIPGQETRSHKRKKKVKVLVDQSCPTLRPHGR